MFSFVVAFLLAVATNAAPLAGYGGAVPSATLSPLAITLSILPLPLLAAVKYTYVRFRRGQSIHAHPHTFDISLGNNPSPLSLPASASIGSGSRQRPSGSFRSTITPYLVGFLGSPQWETTIRSRLDRTLRQAQTASHRSSHRSLRSLHSPAVGDLSRTTVNTSSAYYSSLSHKSCSRSKSASVSFGDTSAEKLPSPRFTSHAFSAITDCSLIHPSSPACQHDVFLPVPPPPAHVMQASSRVCIQRGSPTLMQIMEPVLASWYDDSRGDSTNSSSSMPRTKSNWSSESPSLPFQTPMTSPPTPGMPGAFSAPSMSFTLVRKQLGISATSSALTLSTPSPPSLSVALFHSPIAPSLPVPQPIYTPGVRPESYTVLPKDWQYDPGRLSVPALIHSPTHRSPVPGRPSGIYDVLTSPVVRPSTSPKVSFSPVLGPPASPVLPQGAGPVVLKSALKKRASASPALPSSLRNSVSFSLLSVDGPGADSLLSVSTVTDGPGRNRKSWDLTDLMHNGQLDVDAITSALGLGLGLGSRSSVGSVGSGPSITLTFAQDSANTNTNTNGGDGDASADADVEYDIDQYAAGWGSPQLAQDGAGTQMRWHVHGLQLCAIPEETRSDVCSIAGSVHGSDVRSVAGSVHGSDGGRALTAEEELEVEELVQDSGVVEMDMDSALVDALEKSAELAAASVRTSGGLRPESWREGESVMTLSVGLAW